MWYGLLFTTHSPVVLTVWAETTPDVYQASGYGDLASGDKSIWFVLYLAGFSIPFIGVPPTGSGSLPLVITLTLLPSWHGSMVA